MNQVFEKWKEVPSCSLRCYTNFMTSQSIQSLDKNPLENFHVKLLYTLISILFACLPQVSVLQYSVFYIFILKYDRTAVSGERDVFFAFFFC